MQKEWDFLCSMEENFPGIIEREFQGRVTYNVMPQSRVFVQQTRNGLKEISRQLGDRMASELGTAVKEMLAVGVARGLAGLRDWWNEPEPSPDMDHHARPMDSDRSLE